MQVRSAAFDAAVQKSHIVVSRADIYLNNVFQKTLQISDGNINIQDEVVRRRCTLTLNDYDGTITPGSASDLFAPYGVEAKLFRGIQFPDGTQELLPQGVYGLADVKINDSGEAVSISMDGYDRARRVQRARIVTPYTVSGNIKTAIEALLTSRYPTITYSATWTAWTTAVTIPSTVLMPADDAWVYARKAMLEAVQMDLYFDGNGSLTATLVPDPSTSSSLWTYAEGDGAMILSTSKRLNNEGVYNHFVVTGEHPDLVAPVQGEAYDSNISSPTYIGGAYGDVPTFLTSQFITTVAQAQAAALAMMNKELGATEEVAINSIVHPAHEVADSISIVRAKSKINAVYIVDKITLPLVVDRAMYISTRQRKL